MAARNKSNEITITRVYDAPVKAVWDAWTDPEQVKKWWGPRGFTLTHHSKDLRPGGHWHYTMHGPDGTDWPNKTKYFEVEKYKRLVYDHGGNDEQAPLFRVTATFEELRGKTKLVMTMALATPEAAEETRKFIKKANGESTWDRLAEYLEMESTGKEKFVIHRTFHGTVDKMFDMWTNPEHLARWLPPTGFRMEYVRADIRKGGSSVWMMTDGHIKMYGRAEYLEISRPERLVYTQQFVDENGNVSRHPKAPLWPEKMLTTIAFAQEDAEHVRVAIAWEPYGKATAEEIKTFRDAKPGMMTGWTGSLDKLEALVE